MKKINNITEAVIIAGGYGTRAESYSRGRPKALLKLNRKNLIDFQIESLKKSKIKKIYIVCYHLSNQILKYLKDRYPEIIVLIEEVPKGTAGSLLPFIDHFKSNDLLVLYGDLFFENSLDNFIEFHRNNDNDLSLIFRPNDHHLNSDLIFMSEGFVKKTISKKSNIDKSIYRNNVPIGCYLIKKIHISLIKNIKKEKIDFFNDFIPYLINQKKNIMGYHDHQYFRDIGTLNGFNSAKKFLKEKNNKLLALIDIDGTVTYDKPPFGIVSPAQLKLIPGSSEAIKLLNEKFIPVSAITNRPQLAKGLISEQTLYKIFAKLDYLLSSNNSSFINSYLFCPHHPESGFKGEVKKLKVNCRCRKPNIGMLKDALKIYGKNLETFFVGDSEVDIIAGRKFDVWTYAVRTGQSKFFSNMRKPPHYVFNNLIECVKFNLNYRNYVKLNISNYLPKTFKKNKKFIIAIAGQSKSGKTLLAHSIIRYFQENNKDKNSEIVSLDDLFGNFKSFDQPVLERHNIKKYQLIVDKIKNNKNFYLNRYDPETRKISNIKYKLKVKNTSLIIIDGIFGLLDSFSNFADLKIYVHSKPSDLIDRQIEYLKLKNINNREINNIINYRKKEEYPIVINQSNKADLVLNNINLLLK